MKEIRLLDCTLRDGGHINQGVFGKNVIKSVISNLVKAKVDIIEVGFLWEDETDEDTARYVNICEIKKYLPENMGNSKISVMADNIDLNNIEPYDGTVEYIRLSFRKNELDWAEKTSLMLKEKGYKCYINPIHSSSFSDEEYLNIIKRVNVIAPYGFSIVDTFGAMRQEDLGRLYYLIEHNLDKKINLGVHLHENLGLSYSLAQYILNIVAPKRSITIDGSLYGMGKIPGNLCIEQIMDFINKEYGDIYSLEPVYDSIDEFIMPIYERNRWGYSIPYAISAQCSVHRTYAEYLMKKDRLRTKDIRRILNSISKDKAEIFDDKYIEKKYKDYLNTNYNDTVSISSLKKAMDSYDSFVVIAPGASIKKYKFNSEMLQNSCVICVNFDYEQIESNFIFCTNPKRLGYISDLNKTKLIITSNLIENVKVAKYIISRNELIYHDDLFSDDSTLMVLNLLKKLDKKNIYLAGFDGFKRDTDNFFNILLDRKIRDDDYDSQKRIKIIRNIYSSMNLCFLTPSVYESVVTEKKLNEKKNNNVNN